MEYKRVLLKISGEALSGTGEHGVRREPLLALCEQLKEATQLGVEIAVVVGGGNLLRGADIAGANLPRHTADFMGMLATVMNALSLGAALRNLGVEARVLSALEIHRVVDTYTVDACQDDLRQGRVVVLGGGTGNPYFTTDTCASLRAIEIGADLLLKGTKVDGVYSGDPVKDPTATRYDRITYAEVLERRLGVMDATAIAMCQEHRLPLRVFNMMEEGNIRRALVGEATGTLVVG